MRTQEEKHRKRASKKRIKIWTLKGENVTEYRDKVEEEYQLEADTICRRKLEIILKRRHMSSRRDMWSHQRRETPGGGDLVVE